MIGCWNRKPTLGAALHAQLLVHPRQDALQGLRVGALRVGAAADEAAHDLGQLQAQAAPAGRALAYLLLRLTVLVMAQVL